jgi:hypothetical protein
MYPVYRNYRREPNLLKPIKAQQRNPRSAQTLTTSIDASTRCRTPPVRLLVDMEARHVARRTPRPRECERPSELLPRAAAPSPRRPASPTSRRHRGVRRPRPRAVAEASGVWDLTPPPRRPRPRPHATAKPSAAPTPRRRRAIRHPQPSTADEPSPTPRRSTATGDPAPLYRDLTSLHCKPAP